MSTSKRRENLLALSGVFFAAFFIARLVLEDVLASVPLPLPDSDVVRFYQGSRVAALASSSLQALSAVSLYVFAAFVRATTSKNGALPRLEEGGGVVGGRFGAVIGAG